MSTHARILPERRYCVLCATDVRAYRSAEHDRCARCGAPVERAATSSSDTAPEEHESHLRVASTD